MLKLNNFTKKQLLEDIHTSIPEKKVFFRGLTRSWIENTRELLEIKIQKAKELVDSYIRVNQHMISLKETQSYSHNSAVDDLEEAIENLKDFEDLVVDLYKKAETFKD